MIVLFMLSLFVIVSKENLDGHIEGDWVNVVITGPDPQEKLENSSPGQIEVNSDASGVDIHIK